MLEKLNLSTLLLEEEETTLEGIKSLVASQSNHFKRVEDLNYARTSLVFNNISSSLQARYLDFCLRFFKYFNINSLDILVDSYKNYLSIRNNINLEENLSIANSLAIRYNKGFNPNIITASSFNPKKHQRQISSISSTNNLQVLKKVKTIDLVNLSSISSTSTILTSLLREFLQDKDAKFRGLGQESLIKAILLKVIRNIERIQKFKSFV